MSSTVAEGIIPSATAFSSEMPPASSALYSLVLQRVVRHRVVEIVVNTILNLITGLYEGPMKPDTKRQRVVSGGNQYPLDQYPLDNVRSES